MDLPQLTHDYSYNKQRYTFDIIIPLVLACIVGCMAATLVFLRILVLLAVIFLVVCVYVVVNTLVSHAYPQEVSVRGTQLTVKSFGVAQSYDFAEKPSFSMRDNAVTKQVYVRFSGGGLTRGRYFIACKDLEDATAAPALDLYQYLLDMESALKPNSLRVKSRKNQGT